MSARSIGGPSSNDALAVRLAGRAATELAAHRAQLDTVAAAPLDHETLDGGDITRILTSASPDGHAPGDNTVDVMRKVSLRTVTMP